MLVGLGGTVLLLAGLCLGIDAHATIHHPISRDRKVELASARRLRKLSVRRWYGFVRMQGRVSRRIPALVGVSDIAARDVVTDFGIPTERFHVIPLGVATIMNRAPW